MSFTEIAVEMARRIAQSKDCELESFSLDGVETVTEEDGVETIVIQATARIVPQHDQIPFEPAKTSA